MHFIFSYPMVETRFVSHVPLLSEHGLNKTVSIYTFFMYVISAGSNEATGKTSSSTTVPAFSPELNDQAEVVFDLFGDVGFDEP